jgi:cell division protein FtsI/penicillin-binding protein 2
MAHGRINFILIVISLFGLALIGRLFFIQVIKDDYYKALAQGLYNLDEKIQGERGEIFFQKGEPLAINMEWPLVYASPREIKEKETTAATLSQIINVEKSLILEKLQKDNLYEIIKRKLTNEEIEKIKTAGLKGVYLGKEVGRYYPQETLASQLSGFLDKNGVGQYGIEGCEDELLQGMGENKGSDLVLTVDYSIQFMAEKLLSDARKNLNIKSGQIIVMDPASGKILALANFPDFNPNQYSEISDFDIFQNAATQKIFEPGSVFKPLTMAGALEEEKVTPQTTYVDEGKAQIGGITIFNYDSRTWGKRTMTEVLEKSINTGAVFAEKELGNSLFLEYIEKFGILEPTGIDLQETYSENKEFKKGYEINFATASFGQGIEMTPIQLIRAYGAIINGGKLVRPYIVDKIKENNEIISETKPKIEEDLVISPKTASQLTAMLISVVQNGYAKSAQIPGYYVAGKTGTAQVAWSALGIDKKGYSDQTWQSFVGFAPAFSPQFVILIKLDNPETKTAEYSAVPIFHDLAKYIIDYYQIPPDYE